MVIKTLMMGKTPNELRKMGVAEYHIKEWIDTAILKKHCQWHRGIHKRQFDSGYWADLLRVFDAYSNCFPPYKYPELESDGF